MRAALLFVALVGCTTQTPHPDMCPNCNPQVCPTPFEVVPDASCSVVPLVCENPCGVKCQCWNDVWTCILGTECPDAGDAGVDADAGVDGDAGDAD